MLNGKKNTQSTFTRVRNKRDFPLSRQLLNIMFEAYAGDIRQQKEITDTEKGREVSMSCSGEDIILNYIVVAGILNANHQRGASVPVLTESLYLLQTKHTKQHNNPIVYCVLQQALIKAFWQKSKKNGRGLCCLKSGVSATIK